MSPYTVTIVITHQDKPIEQHVIARPQSMDTATSYMRTIRGLADDRGWLTRTNPPETDDRTTPDPDHEGHYKCGCEIEYGCLCYAR